MRLLREAILSSKARKNFSELLDNANSQPVTVKRKREYCITFSLKQLAEKERLVHVVLLDEMTEEEIEVLVRAKLERAGKSSKK